MSTRDKPNDDDEALRAEFLEKAGLDGDRRRCERKQALDRAWAVRDFEIDLYWRRSLYFWGFQVAFFAAAGVAVGVLNDTSYEAEVFVIVFGILLAALGCISATLWAALERGSKDWQNQWEKLIDLLEDEFTGAIYKTYVISVDRCGPPFSVSKLNSWMTLATASFWFCAIAILLCGLVARFANFPWYCGFGVVVIAVFVFIVLVSCWVGIERSVRSTHGPGAKTGPNVYRVERRSVGLKHRNRAED